MTQHLPDVVFCCRLEHHVKLPFNLSNPARG